MVKRLVICCDGTWNTPDQKHATNVTKLALAVPPVGADNVEQRLFYGKGVGTGPLEHLRGGAFGYGLSRHVKDAYRFVVEHYEPGDQLYLFGFSRGAFTARSTAGLIRNAGVLRREQVHLLDAAYALYRQRARPTRPTGTEATLFRRSNSHETDIHLIGVWDTVGALGIPASGIPLLGRLNRPWSFHDTTLSSHVTNAFQALAIDEQRRVFEPAVWQQQEHAPGQRLEQVWFSGRHSDVGGGGSVGLSDIALGWLLDRARGCGLDVQDSPAGPAGRSWGDLDGPARPVPRAPDPLAPMSDSRTGLYRLWPAFDRPIGEQDHESVARSAVLRTERDARYAPPRLLDYLAVDGPVTGV